MVAEELLTSATNWTAEQLAEWRNGMLTSANELEQRLLMRYLNASKDQPLKRYISFHQRHLITLSDRLFDFQHQKAGTKADKGSEVTDIFLRIEKILENAASFMGRDFDLSVTVSRFRRESLSRCWRTIKISNSDQVDLGLLEAISTSLNNLFDPSNERRPTYHELLYAEKIKGIIENLLTDPKIDTNRLFDRLYQENFNAPAFGLWYQQHFLEKISVLEAADRNSMLDIEFKRLQLIGIPFIRAFHEDRASISEELTGWISKLKSSFKDFPTAHRQSLPLELSVAQLGLFIRLCYLTGCFHENNISGVLRFFVEHFTSKKQAHISKKSLAKAFYSADQGTAATCRAWLLLMVDQINKRYFPK